MLWPLRTRSGSKVPSALGFDGCFDQSKTYASDEIDLVAMRYGFCGM